MEKIVGGFLHIVELLRELSRPGELGEWRRIDPREQSRIMKLPVPKDSSCYPYHVRLEEEQLVDLDDLV